MGSFCHRLRSFGNHDGILWGSLGDRFEVLISADVQVRRAVFDADVQSMAASLRGRMQFAEGQLFGRAAALRRWLSSRSPVRFRGPGCTCALNTVTRSASSAGHSEKKFALVACKGKHFVSLPLGCFVPLCPPLFPFVPTALPSSLPSFASLCPPRAN